MSHICERIEAQCICAILSNKRDILQLNAISSKLQKSHGMEREQTITINLLFVARK